jgi:hypothetical protein
MHFSAAVGHSQTGRVAAVHEDATSFVVWLPVSPSGLLGLKRLRVGAPVHVSRGAAIVSAIQPEIIQHTESASILISTQLRCQKLVKYIFRHYTINHFIYAIFFPRVGMTAKVSPIEQQTSRATVQLAWKNSLMLG